MRNPSRANAGSAREAKWAAERIPPAHYHDASAITTGNIPVARLGTGTNNTGSNYLRDDGTWQPVSGGSTVAPTIRSVNLASKPQESGSFTFTCPSSTIGSLVEAFEVAGTYDSETSDRLEMGMMILTGIVTASTTASMRFHTIGGPVSGRRYFAYRITAV